MILAGGGAIEAAPALLKLAERLSAPVALTIRVGSGGVMLPNHAPLVIAEQFGTLESLYPGFSLPARCWSK